MATPRQSLYSRLPEIYRIRDADQIPPGQLEAYVGILSQVLAGIRDDVEQLYHDFFIETCRDWVVPYIADLLGSSHLSGDPWTLRGDAARTVYHRRRKGTLGAVESLAHTLTGWAAHAVELRERLLWNQHLSHQRPDAGGPPPLAAPQAFGSARRGGTVTLRDPALLSFVDGPFDPFGRTVDLKPVRLGAPGWNLPNLGVFLWRLEDYQVPVLRPGRIERIKQPGPGPGADWVARCVVHPMADPMVFFNTHRYRADAEPPELANPDGVPAPMPAARLGSVAPTGNPAAYVEVRTYAGRPADPGADSVGLVLHLPEQPFDKMSWTFRGANLCAWEEGLRPRVAKGEIVIDPQRGRLLFGVGSKDEAKQIEKHLLVTATHGHSGPTGAQPVSRDPLPDRWAAAALRTVDYHADPQGLRKALSGLEGVTTPTVVEIADSMTHELDLAQVAGVVETSGEKALTPARSLWIRAADGQRPVIRLQRPLRFAPVDPTDTATNASLDVVLEGLYVTWDRAASTFHDPETGLIEQAALNSLVLRESTLDPGGARVFAKGQPPRAPMRTALRLDGTYGYGASTFDQQPILRIWRSITGRLRIDEGYELSLEDSIVDGGSTVGTTTPELAISAATGDPQLAWGPSLSFQGTTVFGRVRVFRAAGEGGLWLQRLEVHDDQHGCIAFSYFSGDGDRLPRNEGCLFAGDADCHLVSHLFGDPGYGQLSLGSDTRILEQGPGQDAMGAFGYLKNAHKWKNVQIRFREFMPVGVRPVLIPVT